MLVVLAAPVLLVCIFIDWQKGRRGFGLTWTVGVIYIGSFVVMVSCERDLVVWQAVIIFGLSGIAIWFCLLVAIISLPKHNGIPKRGKISIGKLKEILTSKGYDYCDTPMMTICHEVNKTITALGYEPLGYEPYEVESVDDLFKMLAEDVEKVISTEEISTINTQGWAKKIPW